MTAVKEKEQMDGEHAGKKIRANDMREIKLESWSCKGGFPLISSCSFNNWGEVASSCGFTEILSARPRPANWNKRRVKPTGGIRSCCYNSGLFTPIKLKLSSRCHAPKTILSNPFLFPRPILAVVLRSDPEKCSLQRGVCTIRTLRDLKPCYLGFRWIHLHGESARSERIRDGIVSNW